MRRQLLGITALSLALTVAAAPSASAADCGSVSAGGKRASSIQAYGAISCASARAKLRRWLPSGLPRSSFGWYCWRRGGDRRGCSDGNGGNAPRFYFRLRGVSGSARSRAAASCSPIVNPYAGTRYEGSDLRRIRATGVSCRSARRLVRRSHRKALGLGAPTSGIRRFNWHDWQVTGNLRGSTDRYTATRGDDRVTWVF